MGHSVLPKGCCDSAHVICRSDIVCTFFFMNCTRSISNVYDFPTLLRKPYVV
jgi:hypothetical protein